MRFIRFGLALALCSIMLILPYRPRVVYGRLVAFMAHLPFLLFGRLARFLLGNLDTPRATGAP